MVEPTLEQLRQEILEAVRDVMQTSSTVFAALLAHLLHNGAVDRAQVEEALRAAEQALGHDANESRPLAEHFLPDLRARLEELLAQIEADEQGHRPERPQIGSPPPLRAALPTAGRAVR